MSIIKKIAHYFVRKEFCINALHHERTDLGVLKEKHTLPVVIGLVLIIFSYLFIIPAFLAIGLIASWLKKPLIGVIGIPLAYGFSWLVFMLGMYLTGTEYVKALGRLIVRVILEKILGDEAREIASSQDCNIKKTGELNG